MMTFTSRAAITAIASLMMIGAAAAQTPAPSTTAPAATTTAPAATKAAPAATKKAEAPRTAASLECSKEADTKAVHGKARKKFMSECKKAAKTKAN